MATYSDITGRLQDWLENNDTEFTTDNMDFAIDLAEQRISKELNADAMFYHKTAAMTAGDPFVTKPSDAVAARSLQYYPVAGGARVFLQFRTFEWCQDYAPTRTTQGVPKYYANWDAETWYVAPTPDAAYPVEASYEARITGLSGATTTTWISLNHPDLLFFAALLESCRYEANTEMRAEHEAAYDRNLATARAEVERIRMDRNNTVRAAA